MAAVKTAVSLQETLLAETDAAARELKTSRSRVIALALADFLRRRRNDDLRARIDKALADDDQADEIAVTRAMRRRQMKLVAGQW